VTDDPRLPVAAPRDARARLARLLRDRARGVAALLGLTAGSTAATLAGPALIGVVVDAVVEGDGARTTVDRAALAFAVLAAVGAALRWASGLQAARLGESALRELRTEVFDHALDLPVEVVERAGTGELVSRLTGDVHALAQAVRTTVPQVVFAAVEATLIVVALVVVDWRLAAAAVVAGAPTAAVGGTWYARHAPARYRREREAIAELSSAVLQGYRGRTALHAHRAAGRYRHRTATAGRAVVDAGLATASARNRLRPSVSASLAAALVAVVVLGAALVDAGTVSVGAVSAAALYVIRLFEPVSSLLEEVDEVQQASAAIARLVGVTQVPAHRARTRATTRGARAAAAEVELRDVRFGYVRDRPVLHGVDLRVAAGEHVVVVGPSGAGKTTIATLVAGTHHPWSGDVRVGGREVGADGGTPVVLVSQEGHVFARSVADNVRLGRPDATDDEVRAALAAVDADRWVDALPDGIETLVGEGHHRLGGPASQQLALARVVCADPAVVVLDEATADLDPVVAARTERHLDAVLAGRTVLAVAHRLDAAARADRVVVVEDGVVVAQGPHEDLVAAGGTYAELWDRWVRRRAGTDADGVPTGAGQEG